MNVLATLPNDIEDLQSPSKKTTKEFLPDNEVEKELLEKIMADREEENHPNQFKFIVRNERASKFDQNRRWAYKWVHNACDSQLKAINEQFPIKTVIIGNGTKELDFDWWIPLKQKGFLFLQ